MTPSIICLGFRLTLSNKMVQIEEIKKTKRVARMRAKLAEKRKSSANAFEQFAKANNINLDLFKFDDGEKDDELQDYINNVQNQVLQVKELFAKLNETITKKINETNSDKDQERYKSKKFLMPLTPTALKLICARYPNALHDIEPLLMKIITFERYKQLHHLSRLIVKPETILVSFMNLNLEKINEDYKQLKKIADCLISSSNSPKATLVVGK